MRVFLTGGTGFIGSEVARRLRARGDEVRALVRNPVRAKPLVDAGCELVRGDLADEDALRAGVRGCDAVVHAAAQYDIGIPKRARAAMEDANVRGTERVLAAAREAGTGRVVYVSTCAVFGDTGGEVVDERYRRRSPYTSFYDETKHRAHEIAERYAAEGLPVVIVQPGAVYGPGDPSPQGRMIDQFLAGRLPAMAFPGLGLNLVHRDDVADGIVLALDKGKPGESYVLGGEIATMRDLMRTLAAAAGRRPPRLTMPTWALKAIAPLGPVLGPLLGQGPNMRELIRSSDGVTFWGSDDKARRELGYRGRPLEQGIRDMLAARDASPPAAAG